MSELEGARRSKWGRGWGGEGMFLNKSPVPTTFPLPNPAFPARKPTGSPKLAQTLQTLQCAAVALTLRPDAGLEQPILLRPPRSCGLSYRQRQLPGPPPLLCFDLKIR